MRSENFGTRPRGRIAIAGVLTALLNAIVSPVVAEECTPPDIVTLFIDDRAHLHENWDTIIMSRIEMSGLIAWPQVIPYLPLALALAVYFVPFCLLLPPHQKF